MCCLWYVGHPALHTATLLNLADKQWTNRKGYPLREGEWMMDKLKGIVPKEEAQTDDPEVWTKDTWLGRRKVEARRWLDGMRTSLAKAG